MDAVMYRIRTVIFLSFIFLITLFPQTTYYVSSSQGNDSNSGTSENSPWKTITKVNSSNFNPGDNILFKRGDKWAGSELVIKNSGNSENRIIFSAYGNGKKPILTLKAEINKTWNQFNSEVWYITAPIQAIPIERMWFNDLEKEQAKSLTGDNWDGTFGICPEHPFYHNASEGRLYVYSISNPGTYYSTIEYQGGLLDEKIVEHTVQLIDADYVTLDGLDIQGGGYGALGLAGSDYSIIKNCNIGKYSGRAGIFANSSRISKLANDQTSDYGEISNCIIDSDWNYTLKFYTSLTPYGILIGFGASNWKISGNYIKDWWFGVYSGTGVGLAGSYYHEISNNEITAPNFSYGKGIQIYSWSQPGTGVYSWCKVYNNYIHNIRAAGICVSSSGNKIYFNIIDSIDVSRCPEKGDQANSGMGIEIIHEIQSTELDSNYVFNNTFYRLNREAMNWGKPFIYNNLFLNTQMALQGNYIAINQFGATRAIKNNLFFKTGSNISSYFIYLSGTGIGYTIAELNLLGSSVSGNIYPNGFTMPQIMNNNYTLPTGSPALISGINISTLVPEGFRDRLGNLVDRTDPDIGAIQFTSASDIIPPRLVSATLMDSTKLLLTFSEPLSQSGITNLSNYLISNGITIQSTQLNNINQSEITLTTSPHVYGQNYTVRVDNLKDVAENIIQSSNNSAVYQHRFNPSPTGLSKLLIIHASASDTDDVNYGPDKTVDGLYYSNGGNPSSRWAAIPCPQWLIYDLGMVKQINKLRISFYEFQNGRRYNYSISISNDKLNWVSIVDNALSSNQEWTENVFNQIEARYLKLDLISNNQVGWATVWETEIWGYTSSQTTIVNTKAYLQGSFNNTEMHTNLHDPQQIPLNQPYNSSPWNYLGNETVTTLPSGVVDWVLVELRSNTNSNSMIGRRAGFIMSNGYIVDLDGINPINFPLVPAGEYYIVIRHRNHLSIMSASKVSLSSSYVFYDFTDSLNKAYGNEPMVLLADQKYAMYAGDGDANGAINVIDYGTVGNYLFQTGYFQGDLDLNGIVNVLDYGKTNQNLLKVSNVP